jgi:hypothetical protein
MLHFLGTCVGKAQQGQMELTSAQGGQAAEALWLPHHGVYTEAMVVRAVQVASELHTKDTYEIRNNTRRFCC